MKFIFSFLLVLGLAACASGGRSSDCAYRNLVGKNIYGPEVDKLRQSGHEVRLLYPDSYLGFQKNPNRVNLIRDQNDEIVAVTCG